ncbi:hypothetical protein [Clostridium lacusfryxellense]|uniref:hypothetical protein n=1 Tax=Clostridium lacusfryxellense TaxID=205328 RepID=UPI001C0BE546|nr:hypothetical protein [Clostridium lacusfryxellense]MBU3110146.1 hypothetical protein [Clostridium lacusfryxellense]
MSYKDINNYHLQSYDSASLKVGFELYKDRLYITQVSKSELQHICKVDLKVDYRGHTFDVAELNKDTLYIYTNNLKISKELNLDL